MLRDRRYNKKAEKKRIQEIRDTVYIICEQVKDSDYCKDDLEGDILITKAYVEFALKYSQSIKVNSSATVMSNEHKLHWRTPWSKGS